jgi:hypothetical protein
MIINLKTAKMLSITLKRRPLLGRAGISVPVPGRPYDVCSWG